MEKRTAEEIRMAMQKLEDRFDHGEISEKVFSLRYQSLKEELNEYQIEQQPIRKPVQSPHLIRLSEGITCRQYLEMELAGHYRILKELGRGGMGIVYQAEDAYFKGQRIVAIKVLPQNLSQISETLEDFKREFLTACQLVHQNICAMYEFGQDSDLETYFLVIEYLEGETLAEILNKNKRLTFSQTIPILEQVADGLDFAHSKGVLHLDMKPGNIMVSKAGHAKIMDFGLAQKLHGDKTHIRLNKTFGTPLYLAPEQVLSGEQNVVRSATDLWAMAVMVYELLQGEPPFKGSTVLQLSHNIISTTPKPIVTIPKAAWQAILKALSKEPQKRFSSCREFVEAMKKNDSTSFMSSSGIYAKSITNIKVSSLIKKSNNNGLITQLGKPSLSLQRSQNIQHLFWITTILILLFLGFFLQQIFLENKIENSEDPILYSNSNQDPWEDKNLELPVELQQSCWVADQKIWDFTAKSWKNLSINEQLRYARAYQNWYADLIKQPVEKKINIQNIIITMRLIPPGKFLIGSPTSELGRNEDELQHTVTISQAYWLSKYEITQEQWQSVMKSNPSFFKGAGLNAPVENIDWANAQDFCKKIECSLPTEAQWEYASRSGTSGMGYLGDFEILGINNAPKLGKIAWYAGNSGANYTGAQPSHAWPQCEISSNYSGTHTVGQKIPNAWGIYDMLGNVTEWCQDWYGKYSAEDVKDPSGNIEGITRLQRGGSWRHAAQVCRVANRSRWGQRLDFVGLRVVQSLP